MSNSDPFSSLWVERYRPKTLDDIVLTKEDREFFVSLKTKQDIPHLLFAGTPGVGKSSIAKILVNDILDCQYLYINASDENGIDTIRGKIVGFARTKSFDGKLKVILLDEFDGLSGEAMKALRNVMEEYAETCRFILTCNYLFKVIAPIQSRCQILNLIPPVEGVLQRVVEILKKEEVNIPQDQKASLLDHIKKNLPDLRRIINDIQKYSITGNLQIRNEVSAEFVEKIFEKIQGGKDLMAIRREVIENEKEFSNDYRHFLKEMFEIVFRSDITHDRKASALLSVSKGLELDAFVVDKEINCFTALLNLKQVLS